MTDNALQKKTHPCAEIIQQRSDALREIVGEASLKRFMSNVLSTLKPTNAKGEPNKLLQCSPQSFYAAAHQAAVLGLEPGPMKECSLVPYKGEATLLVEYRGYCKLAYRHPLVSKITARPVYRDDLFEHDMVTGEMKHTRPPEGDSSDPNLVGAWCRVVIHDSDEPITLYMTRAEIDKRAPKKKTNFWRDHYAAMCRKTVIRALLGSGEVPTSTELMQAIQHEERMEFAEVTEVKTEPLAPVKLGFDSPTDDETNDEFGLTAERAPADEVRVGLLLQISELADKAGMKDNELLDAASFAMEETILDLEELTVIDLQKVLAELESR